MDHISYYLRRCLANKAFSLTVPLQMPLPIRRKVEINDTAPFIMSSPNIGRIFPPPEERGKTQGGERKLVSRVHGIATFPPFGPIEGHKWFFQTSSQWESQKNRFAFVFSAKSVFNLPVFQISCSCRTASDCVSWRWVTKLQVEQFHAKTTLGCDLLETLSVCGVLRIRCCLTNSSDTHGGNMEQPYVCSPCPV